MNILHNYYYSFINNIDYFGVLALIFLATGAIVFAVFFLFGRQNAISERLSRLLPSKQGEVDKKPQLMDNGSQGFVAKFTKHLHDIVVPKEGATKKKARLKFC